VNTEVVKASLYIDNHDKHHSKHHEEHEHHNKHDKHHHNDHEQQHDTKPHGHHLGEENHHHKHTTHIEVDVTGTSNAKIEVKVFEEYNESGAIEELRDVNKHHQLETVGHHIKRPSILENLDLASIHNNININALDQTVGSDNKIINNYLGQSIKDNQSHMGSENQLTINIHNPTMKDYMVLNTKQKLRYDNRSLCRIYIDELISNHLALKILLYKSIINPVYLRVTLFVLHTSILLGMNALLFSDTYIESRLQSQDRVLYISNP
jgi:hypothetical protein